MDDQKKLLEQLEEAAKALPGAPKASEIKLCQLCGHDQSVKRVEIHEDDKREYMRRLLAGQAFEKKYTALEGRLQITFKELSQQELDRLIDYVATAGNAGTFLRDALRLKMVSCCSYLALGDKLVITAAPDVMAVGYDDLMKQHQECFGKQPTGIATLTENLFNRFNTLLDGAIQEAIRSSNF